MIFESAKTLATQLGAAVAVAAIHSGNAYIEIGHGINPLIAGAAALALFVMPYFIHWKS